MSSMGNSRTFYLPNSLVSFMTKTARPLLNSGITANETRELAGEGVEREAELVSTTVMIVWQRGLSHVGSGYIKAL